MREVVRHENKYLLSFDQFRKIEGIFERSLHQDSHNGETGYLVRSLYFDTLQERDFHEKIDGLETRRKIRLRIYDPSAEFAMLEMKQKQGQNQKKRAERISRKDAIALTQGQYSCLLNYESPFLKECYGLMTMMHYQPKSIIEYKRKAYVEGANKTRITFDYNLQATESNYHLFSKKLNLNPVLDTYLVVMEVKYSGFMLSYIKDIISIKGKSPTALSKYCLSRSSGLHYSF